MMQRLLLRLIGAYQRWFSVLLKGGKPCCRFAPSCSEYAHEAIQRYGAGRGSLRALWRILRCNPFGGSGYDPP